MTTRAVNAGTKGKANAASKKEIKSKPNGKGAGLKVWEIPIEKIAPDPNQPRKTFDESSLELLSNSIKEHGVLQPITIRKTGNSYMVAMGERRYRASKMAGLKSLPCMARDYDETKVLEVQIVENLQRQEVEPTEEAEAIAYLNKKYPPADIAKRLGRTDNFVRQRLKLAGLIEGFKHFVRSGEMTITLGVAVALFEPEEQQMMLEALEGKFNAHQVNRMVQNKTFDLANAPFDVNDKKLIAKAGACTACPFNAANQGNLFGAGKMLCTKASCFETKKSKSFLNLIERSKRENCLLVPEIRAYWADDESNQLVISQMESLGLEVYLLDDVEVAEKPLKPTLEKIKEENRHYDYTEEELKAEYEEALEAYKEEQGVYDTALENGFTKGFLVDPKTYISKAAYIRLIEKAENEPDTSAAPLSQRKMADCSPEEQIAKIKERELRKQHIENNRQFEDVVQMVRKTEYINNKKTLSTDEMIAFSISLYENNVDYVSQQKIFSDMFGKSSKMDRTKMLEHFKKNFKKEIFHKLIRFILTQQVHFGESNHTNNLVNMSFYSAMQGYHRATIAEIETRYDKEREKREGRLKERIAVLEKKVQALSA